MQSKHCKAIELEHSFYSNHHGRVHHVQFNRRLRTDLHKPSPAEYASKSLPDQIKAVTINILYAFPASENCGKCILRAKPLPIAFSDIDRLSEKHILVKSFDKIILKTMRFWFFEMLRV
jgi:hypothetical protein